MENFYSQIGIEPRASAEDIARAYEQQRQRYDPQRVIDLDPELRTLAEQRTAALDNAYRVLSDPQQRQAYDQKHGFAVKTAVQQRQGLNARERWYLAGGAVAALVVIALVWILTGRNATNLPVVGEVNRPAPDFALPALGGGTVKLSDYRGKIVLVNFWGTWCEPCKEETPALQGMYQQLRDKGLVVIGIDLLDTERSQGRSETDVQRFTEQYGVTYPIALDTDGKVANAFRIYPIPTSYFIDAQGQIRYVRVSTLTSAEVLSLFNDLQQAASQRSS